MTRRGDVDGLRAALRYRDVYVEEDGSELDLGMPVRLQALHGLSEQEDPEAAEGLVEALADPTPAVREAAVEAIGRRQEPTGVEPLVDLVVTPPEDEADAGIATAALTALKRWRLEGLPEVFVEKLLQPGAPPLEDRHLETLDALLASDPRGDHARRQVAERLIAALGAPEPPNETALERILSWLGPAAADSVLVALPNGTARPALLRAAGRMRDGRAVEPLIGWLDSSSVPMRESAAAALGGLNDTRAVPALLTATQDAEQSVRDAASASLDRMGVAALIVGLATLVRGEGPMLSGDGGPGEQLAPTAPPAHARAEPAVEAADEPVTVADAEPAAPAEASEAHAQPPTTDTPPPAPAASPSPLGGRRYGGLVGRLLGRRV